MQPGAELTRPSVESSALSQCGEEDSMPTCPANLDQELVGQPRSQSGTSWMMSAAVVATPLRYPHVREGDAEFWRASTTNLAEDLERLDRSMARVSQKSFL